MLINDLRICGCRTCLRATYRRVWPVWTASAWPPYPLLPGTRWVAWRSLRKSSAAQWMALNCWTCMWVSQRRMWGRCLPEPSSKVNSVWQLAVYWSDEAVWPSDLPPLDLKLTKLLGQLGVYLVEGHLVDKTANIDSKLMPWYTATGLKSYLTSIWKLYWVFTKHNYKFCSNLLCYILPTKTWQICLSQ